MGRRELERWLCADGPGAASDDDVPALLADLWATPQSPQRQSIRFVLAVLRDTYPDDAAVWRWLNEPRRDLENARPAELLRSGRAAQLEALVVAEWNAVATGAA